VQDKVAVPPDDVQDRSLIRLLPSARSSKPYQVPHLNIILEKVFSVCLCTFSVISANWWVEDRSGFGITAGWQILKLAEFTEIEYNLPKNAVPLS
jgi:hypothetical protein